MQAAGASLFGSRVRLGVLRSGADIYVIAGGLVALNLLYLVGASLAYAGGAAETGELTLRLMPALAAAVCTIGSLACLVADRRAVFVTAGLGTGIVVWAVALLAIGHVYGPDGLARHAPGAVALFGFIYLGLAMAVLAAPSRTLVGAGTVLVVVVVTLSLFRVMHWVTPALMGGASGPFDPNSFVIALSFALIGVGLLWWHPRLQFRREFLRSSIRGQILRAGFLVILVVPIVINLIAWILGRTTLWDQSALFAAVASLTIAGGGVLVWWFALAVDALQNRTRRHVAELTRANEVLERYASSTAHDLKAPIRHIRVYSELMIEAINVGDTARALKYAQGNIDSSDTLLSMVESLLSYARSENEPLTLQEHRLSEIVRSARKMVADDLGKVGGRVEASGDHRIVCDRHLMENVFRNLISNSISHGGSGELVVRVDAERRGDEWRITYQDNGAGFDDDFIPKAFDYLARGLPQGGDGSGIGLTTCRTIVSRHGGDISIDADFNAGARLIIVLPVAPVSEPAKPSRRILGFQSSTPSLR